MRARLSWIAESTGWPQSSFVPPPVGITANPFDVGKAKYGGDLFHIAGSGKNGIAAKTRVLLSDYRGNLRHAFFRRPSCS